MWLHFVNVHEEHPQTEAEGAVDRAEHEIQREYEELCMSRCGDDHKHRRQHGQVVVQPNEHGVQEGSDRAARKLDGEHVQRQLQQPQDRRDDAQDAQHQLRHRKQGVVLLVVQVLGTKGQVVFVQRLARRAVLRRRRLRLLLQATLLLPSVVAVLRTLRLMRLDHMHIHHLGDRLALCD